MFTVSMRKNYLIQIFARRWYPLKCKPGQSKNDYRGDLEVRTAFTVKAVTDSDKLGIVPNKILSLITIFGHKH